MTACAAGYLTGGKHLGLGLRNIYRWGIQERFAMLKFLLWCLLLFFCWPLALIALILYPIVWLILLPFRIVGVAVDGVLELLKSIFMLPARVLRGPARA
jgi:hypothetical protein